MGSAHKNPAILGAGHPDARGGNPSAPAAHAGRAAAFTLREIPPRPGAGLTVEFIVVGRRVRGARHPALVAAVERFATDLESCGLIAVEGVRVQEEVVA
jgi:hypothetical protein